ncbi:MAG: flagellar hook-length control protein FliK [Oscillospiraceae bacterium]|nr:flagellar hook-length control protein FliK [Oscillospiraceae bacterium]
MRSMSIGTEPIAVTSLYPNPQTVSDGGFAQTLQDTVDVGSAPAPQPQQPVQSSPQQPSEVHTETAEQTADVKETPVQSSEAAELDPELMKELADLLGKTEEMLSAPQRMQKTLENMMVQALSELSDPDVDEDEFTEMVLDFLMEFIDRKFGGETEDTSIITENNESDDDDSVQDVLLQAVVQMLDNIRSEERQTETAEEDEAVEAIPSTEMARESVTVAASPLLGEETEQAMEIESFTEAPQAAAAPQQETDRQPQQTEEMSQEQPTQADTELYQAAMQTAESIYIAVTQSQQPQEQPVGTERSRETAPVSEVKSPEPANELEELTRLVKGGETVKSEQPQSQPDLSGGQKEEAEPIKPAAKPEAPFEAVEAVPFEAAIASTVPQITLTRAFEGGERGAQQIVTQIVSEVFNQLPEAGGTTTFVMTLNPESLGKVTVKIVEEAGKISVSVAAHERRTAEILSQRFDTLQTAMKENGTQLEKYQVVYAPEKDEGAGQQNFDGSSKNPYVKQDDEEGEDDGKFAEILQQAV